MPKGKLSPAYIAAHIRRVLKDGGSAPHAEDVQWFFKEEVKSRGWYTAELRKVAIRLRRTILQEQSLEFLIAVADQLFTGEILDEKNCAVMLLENRTEQFGEAEFRRFVSWLPRVCTWADHDALVYYLLSPMTAAKPARVAQVFGWAKSRNHWHRRAACVALIRGTRQKNFFAQITRLSNLLLNDEDDMVRKGLGWLLRETAKADAQRTIPYLLKIRDRAPRLVLRTACEKLSAAERKRILG